MRRIRLAELAVFILLGASITVSAHDFWLVPNAFMINPGESLIISANTGMDFPNSLSAVTPDRLDRFVLIGESRRENLSEFTVQGNSLTARCAVEKAGTYVIAAALKPKEIKLTGKEFNEYLLADGLPDIYELRKREGILEKDAVEYYSKYPKTVIHVGEKKDDAATRPVGLPIEIIPRVNPYTLKMGDKLEVSVFFQGKPLPRAEIAWSYPGQGEGFAGSTKTDDTGRTSIPLVKTGPYVIRLTHMEWVKKPTHEWES